MAIITSKTALLSRDIVMAIRYHCYGNLSEFFNRHQEAIGMSKSTFYRVIQGEYSSVANVEAVEKIVESLGLTKDGGASEFLIKKKLIKDLMDLVDITVSQPSIDNLGRIAIFLRKYRYMILA